MPANALRLDISAETDVKAVSYGKLLYGGKTYNSSFMSEKTRLGFYVSGIELDNMPDSLFGAGIAFQSISGLPADKMADIPALAQPQESFPSVNSMPYLREAYIRVDNFISRKLSFSAGLQDFSLGQGISLGTDNAGFAGFVLHAEDLFWGYGADIFYFNPSRYDAVFSTNSEKTELDKYERKYNVYGASLNNKTEEGEWQLYHFYQHYGASSLNSMGGNSVSETRSFTGIRYAMKKKHISFDGEAVAQAGNSDLAGGKGDFSGYAFMLKSSWEQGIYIFDNVKLRLAYGRSSQASYDGEGNIPPDRDNSFYAALGARHDGFLRGGYGAIAGASLYDISPSSGTANGLPDGLSGLSIVNAGLDVPYKKILFSADYYKFKADSINSVSRITVADEVDLRITFPLGRSAGMEMLYAYFSPGEKAFVGTAGKTSLGAFSLKAKF